MRILRRALAHGIAVLAASVAFLPVVHAQPVNAKNYPELSDKELGQIRHLVKMGNQLPGDWSGFGTQWVATEGAYGFQSAFSVMALALAQHQHTPAYRELYKKAIEGYIAKLQHQDVWERFMFSSRAGSRGGKLADMDRGLMDPVIKDNNMLKGYLLQSGAAYEMLYGDLRYEEPGAYTFFHKVWGFGNGQIKFRYTLGDIAGIIHKEVVDSNYVGSACEPGQIFWTCNAVSNTGFIHYDLMHGTHYSDALPKMKDVWIQKGAIDPKNYMMGPMVQTSWGDRAADQQAAPAVLPMVTYLGSWAGLFNHAWDPEFTKASYFGVDGRDRDQALKYFLSGDYSHKNVDRATYLPSWGPFLGFMDSAIPDKEDQGYYSVVWGFFIAFAAEVGDEAAVNKLLAYAERNFGPVWQNGEYYYPRNDDFSVDAQGNSHGVDPWTGNVFLAMARLNKGDGFRKLYQDAWTNADRAAPEIAGVDAVTTSVSQAWWDADKKALIVTLQPGPVKAQQTHFNVVRLDPDKRYDVIVDGKSIGTLTRGGSLAKGTIRWDGADLSVSTPLAARRSFVFVQS